MRKHVPINGVEQSNHQHNNIMTHDSKIGNQEPDFGKDVWNNNQGFSSSANNSISNGNFIIFLSSNFIFLKVYFRSI